MRSRAPGDPLVVLTDIDGTLVDDEGEWAEAEAALAALRRARAHVVPLTSKTAAEVEPLREAMRLRGPWVVESGSRIHVPAGALPDSAVAGWEEADAGGRALTLGRPYAETRAALRRLAGELGAPLRGFGDATAEEIAAWTGLPPPAAARAARRACSEAFLPHAGVPLERARVAAGALGFDILAGDRFWHLVARGVDKGTAARFLLALYRASHPGARSLALGNGPHDARMLEAADEAVVVPGPAGPHPSLAGHGWPVAPASGPAGWAAAVLARIGAPGVTLGGARPGSRRSPPGRGSG